MILVNKQDLEFFKMTGFFETRICVRNLIKVKQVATSSLETYLKFWIIMLLLTSNMYYVSALCF